jgi:hypothetical protein
MKNVFLLLLLSAIFLTTSCKKDDDAPQLTKENIEGTWRVTLWEDEGTIGIGAAGVFDNSDVSSFISNSMLTITFNADGTWTSDGDYTRTSTSDGDTDVAMETGIGSGAYSVSGGKLTMEAFDFDNFDPVFDTKSFSVDKKIELENKFSETETGAFLGLDVKLDLTTKMTLEK